MTKKELHDKYYVTHISSHSKGRKGGKKVKVTITFNESFTRREYLTELSNIDRAECGLFLCRIECRDLKEDRWWDVPNYRDSHLKEYRSRITAIRKEYGLTSKEVAEFMRVA